MQRNNSNFKVSTLLGNTNLRANTDLPPKIPFIDLFCGAGGLSVGFEMAGFQSVFANDNDSYACETYSLNHPNSFVFKGDVEELTAQEILETTGLSSIPLVIGGPNCQGVSLRGKRDPNDPKNKMFFHFKRLIDELQPEWFVMENVPGLLHRHNQELVKSIFDDFNSIGYNCGGEVLLAADYGVPQLRYRFVLIGNRLGRSIVLPNPTHRCPLEFDKRPTLFSSKEDNRPFWRTVEDAIGDLPPISNGGGDDIMLYPERLPKSDSEHQLLWRDNGTFLFNHKRVFLKW